MASPLCQVKVGAGAYASTTNGINATPGSVVVINLISSIGAPTWAIACVYADDLSTVASVNASLTIDPVGRTATFTAPVAGRGYIFQSVINAGNNLATNQPDPTTATTFGIWVPTASGARVLIPNETFESSVTSGWVADVNFPIRNPSTGGGTVPTGTGIPHIVGGAQNAAATLIVNADVDPAAAIAASKLAAPGASGNPLVNSSSAVGAATNWTMGTGLAGGAGSFVSFGTSPNIGEVRLPNGGAIYGLGPGAENGRLIRYGSSGVYVLEVGEVVNVGEVRLLTSSLGSVNCVLGSTYILQITSSAILMAAPVTGFGAASIPYREGTVSVPTSATTTLTAAQYANPMITLAAGAVAAFTVVLPLSQGAAFDIYNATAFTSTIGGATGATITCAVGAKVRAICPDGANYR